MSHSNPVLELAVGLAPKTSTREALSEMQLTTSGCRNEGDVSHGKGIKMIVPHPSSWPPVMAWRSGSASCREPQWKRIMLEVANVLRRDSTSPLCASCSLPPHRFNCKILPLLFIAAMLYWLLMFVSHLELALGEMSGKRVYLFIYWNGSVFVPHFNLIEWAVTW